MLRRHRPLRSALIAVVLSATAVLGMPSTASAAHTCAAYETITQGKYYVNNNLWGQDNGNGWQCAWDTYQSGDTIGWGTSWDWTSKAGQNSSVKSYTSSVLGWHWGWKTQNTQLPTQLSANRPVRTSWNFNVTQNNVNTLNVAYDLWLHDIPNPDWQSQPTDEVMIWLYTAGGAGPVGSKVATLNVGGASWDLYQGDIGWKVHSFVRTSNTTSANLNLADFTNALVNRGSIANSKYLSSVQAGTEVFNGRGQLDTNSYTVTVG